MNILDIHGTTSNVFAIALLLLLKTYFRTACKLSKT
jgi:hypothetical protein